MPRVTRSAPHRRAAQARWDNERIEVTEREAKTIWSQLGWMVETPKPDYPWREIQQIVSSATAEDALETIKEWVFQTEAKWQRTNFISSVRRAARKIVLAR